MGALVDAYDAAFFDLDGVVYLGPEPVPGAVEAVAGLSERSVALMYVTNNAARSADTVVAHLNRIGLPASLEQVLTSAQVAAEYLRRELPSGARILIAGSQNLGEVIAAAGFEPVRSADDEPVAVLQGYDPELAWPLLDEACLAIERGARWYSCNDDTNRPTDRGTVPGVGGMIAALRTALGGDPKTFGKPFRPMMDEVVRRTGATRPIFVGDRLDTDISGANGADMASLLVFTGVHGKADLLGADASSRPTAIGADVGALLLPPRTLARIPDGLACGSQQVNHTNGELVLAGHPDTVPAQLDALWALANLYWEYPGSDASAALAALEMLH
jgi:HAD superfamily hydrolase (TIGR01450 family)